MAVSTVWWEFTLSIFSLIKTRFWMSIFARRNLTEFVFTQLINVMKLTLLTELAVTKFVISTNILSWWHFFLFPVSQVQRGVERSSGEEMLTVWKLYYYHGCSKWFFNFALCDLVFSLYDFVFVSWFIMSCLYVILQLHFVCGFVFT